MSDKCFVAISNSAYMSVVKNLVLSAHKHHPEILFEFYGINLTENDIVKLKQIHNNINVHNIQKEFINESLEGCWAGNEARPLFIKQTMETSLYDVLYLDGDMIINDKLNNLFEFVSDYDFVVNPSRYFKSDFFRCNDGLVWVKNTTKNINLVDEWRNVTVDLSEDGNPEYKICWLAEQHALDIVIQKYHFDLNEVSYSRFLEDHLSEIKERRSSLITHYKGNSVKKPLSWPGREINNVQARRGSILYDHLGLSE
jgi:hypothetical protein